MLTLLIRANQALLDIPPSYLIAAGSDIELTFVFSAEWSPQVAPVAVFTKDGQEINVPIVENKCRVPLELVEPSHFTLTVKDEKSENVIMVSESLNIYVAPTIKGETCP